MNVKATTVGITCHWCPDQPVLTKGGKIKPLFTQEFIKGAQKAADIMGWRIDGILEDAELFLNQAPFQEIMEMDSSLINQYHEFPLDCWDCVDTGPVVFLPDTMYISRDDVENWKEYFAFRLLESSTGENDE